MPTKGASADAADPGTVRPGGRTARVRASVLRAVGDALVEHGFHSLDLADVARRAEVGKTTVYRRWGTTTGLIADLLADMADMAEQSVPRTGSGSLTEDLRSNARLVAATLTDPRQGPLFKAVIAAATCDERTAWALHRFYATRIKEWAPCVEGAVARGELPAGTDARESDPGCLRPALLSRPGQRRPARRGGRRPCGRGCRVRGAGGRVHRMTGDEATKVARA